MPQGNNAKASSWKGGKNQSCKWPKGKGRAAFGTYAGDNDYPAKERAENYLVACSKALTRVLRHDAGKWKLPSLGPDGYVKLDELLTNVQYLKSFTYDDVEDVV